jgi:hypothetical protein
MAREADAAHVHAAMNAARLEGGASELNTLLQKQDREEAEEADAAAAVAVDPPLAVLPSADADVARRVVARWRVFLAERTACPLLDLLQRHPDLFVEEVLKRLKPTVRTMLAQVGRPWLAAVLASGLPRLHKISRVRLVRLQLREFCTSAERLAWAKANG